MASLNFIYNFYQADIKANCRFVFTDAKSTVALVCDYMTGNLVFNVVDITKTCNRREKK